MAIPPSKLESVEAPLLTPYERNIMQDLVEILTPFKEVTDFVQVVNFPSAEYFIRMAIYEEEEEYRLAAALDCRSKLRWCKASENKIEDHVN